MNKALLHIKCLTFLASFVLSLLFTPLNAFAFKAPYGLPEGKFHWRHIGVNQGLPSSETYFIHQDRKGYIWICTDRGVVRYDGSKKKIYTKKDGLSDDVVFKVYEDFKGRIWFITYNGMLSYFENDKIHPFKYNSKIKSFLNGYQATFKNFVVLKDETILLGLQDIGAIQISKNGKSRKWGGAFSNQIGFCYEKLDQQYFAAFNGSKRIKLKDKQRNDFVLYELKNKKKYSKGVFESPFQLNVCQNNFGNFLVLDEWLVNLKNTSKKERFQLLINAYVDNEYVWACCLSKGVTAIPKHSFGKNGNAKLELLKGYSVSSVLKDFQGGYWFTTLENGVFYIPNLDCLFWNVENGLYGTEVLEVNGTKESLVLSYMNGFEIYDPNFKQFFNRKKNTLVATCATKKGVMFLSGYGVLKKEKTRFVQQNHLLNCINIVETNHGFINGYTSLIRVYPDLPKRDTLYAFVVDSKKKTPVFNYIAESKKDELYVGNLNGILKVKDHAYHPILPYNKLFSNRVDDLVSDPHLGIIVATRGVGVYFLKNDQVWEHINKDKGLLDDDITDIEVDEKGDLYCASYKGISRIRFHKNGQYTIRNITKNDGLISNEIGSIHLDDTFIWMGTKNGLISIRKKAFDFMEITTNMLLEEVFVNGHKRSKISKIEAVEGVPSFKFNFRSENYKLQGKHKFKYRFSKEQDWVFTDKSTITLSYPASGEYLLEIAELNDQEQWNEPTALLKFTVNPPFYRTWWVIMCFFITGIILVYLFYRRRLKNVNNKFLLQKRVNELEQKALTAQMNPHFIFNSLNSIQSFLLYKENEKAEKYLLKFSKLIRATLANSRETFITIEQEVELLTNYIELEKMRFQDHFDFEIEVKLTGIEKQLQIPPMLIQPFVENAIIHGLSKRNDGGLLIVRFEKMDETIQVSVIDNGVGMLSTSKIMNKHRSFGTEITKERMAIFEKNFNQSFTWKTENAVRDLNYPGTKVEIIIPINRF